MAIIKAFAGALGGTFADLWKDIITAGRFDEYVVVAPGVPRGTNNGRGSNEYGSEGVISNGSHIYVPENTAAFIFSESGIENVITEPGGYEYRDGEKSVLAGDGIGSLFSSVASRFTFGGQPVETKYVAFVNLVRSAALSSALQRRWSTMTNSMAWIWRYGRGARCH